MNANLAVKEQIMKTTIPKLRRVIRKVITEAWSKERGFYAKEEDLPIYYEELEKLSHVKSHRKKLDMMVKAIEARGLRWDVHTFEAAYGKPA